MAYPRQHKYRAKPTIYKGRKYASKAEAAYAARLDADPDVMWWLRQPAFDLGEDTRYRADFLVGELGSGHLFVYAVDVKGVETDAFKRIKRLWQKYGVMPLHVVKRGETIKVIIVEEL